MDIKKAIQIEDEYIKCRLRGEEPFHLADKICECGFDGLEQYFEEKKEYLFSQIQFQKFEANPLDAVSKIESIIRAGIDGVLLVDTNQTVVYYGDVEFNREYCEDNDIPLVSIGTSAGAFITAPNEISIGIFLPSEIGIDGEWILQKFKNIFERYMDNVVVDNNDILVDGKKVLGSAFYNIGNRFGFVSHISFTDNLDTISAICHPSTSGKIPGYITAMTRDDLRREVMEWLL